MAIGSPQCSRSWVRYQPMARRTDAGPPSRSASDAVRSSGSRMRHTSERCWVQGRSAQSWANMPPRALTGASWWASPTRTVLAPAAVVAVSSWRRSSVPTMAASSTMTSVVRAELQFVVAQQLQGFGDGQALVSGAFAHRDVDGLAGRRQHQHRAAVAAVRGARAGRASRWSCPRRPARTAVGSARVSGRCSPRRASDPATGRRCPRL